MKESILALLVILTMSACADQGSLSIDVKKPDVVVVQPPPVDPLPEIEDKRPDQYERCTRVCHLRLHRKNICQYIVYGE